MQDESYLSEHSLREALERMGMGNKGKTSPQGSEGTSRPQAHQEGRGPSRARVGQQTTARRRRFAGDDTVVVEHQTLTRPGQKRHTNRAAITTEAGQEQERLKQSLQRERRRAHDAEAEIALLGERVRTATTQITHLRLQVDEGKAELRKRDEEILRLRSELHQLKEQQRKKSAAVETVKTAPLETDESGQEPVQWWKD
ncbi:MULTISPECIES: hypothetical protein [Bombella]|uniref:Uncharacterized protein n=1 Tax=Bombella pollinis TaxID=2967337 RepID=A0ABT3WJZ7_9PROT|nr:MULTISPECIES: hypothetical protein [Bombella]MCX5619437.1 hypothetical protein [Bombella pollinis]MUG90450.1 hypothetical protein [Bombella sp. ESL0385]